MNLRGNYTALITPFRKNRSVDFKTLSKITTFQLNNLTDGIVALGSTAEAPMLSSFEKRKVLETIVNTASGQVPIIAGVNAFSLSDALCQVKSRFIDGANALLVAPPPYIKPTESGLYKFFSSIADNSYLPIILYNIPSRTNVKISEELIDKLACHENIIGVKEASGDISYAQKLAKLTENKDFTIITGNDNLILPMLSIKAKAIISVVGNVCPKLCHDIIDLVENNKPDIAKNLYFKYFGLIESLSLESNPIPIKYLMHKLGLIKPYYREPLAVPSAKVRKLLNKVASEYFY